MNRNAVTATVIAIGVASATLAHAQKKKESTDPISLPSVGETLAPNGGPTWPQKLEWMYDLPSFSDATGKVALHWFCSPKVTSCTEDLARVVTLKENVPRLYIIAYVSGARGDAKKLDPIRESEGVGRGTVAFGKNAIALMKRMSIPGPVSIVVGIDNKVAFVTTGSSPSDLDARDAKVTSLAGAIKDYTATSDGPKIVKPDDKFRLAMTINLASWLKYSKRTVPEFKLTAPRDIKCDHTTLRGDQIKVTNQAMVAQVSCSGPKGVYELRGTITFGYDNPVGGGAGLGTDGATWKFEIKPMGMR
jgi:hypothetical protein